MLPAAGVAILALLGCSGCVGLAHMREGVIKGVDLPDDVGSVLRAQMSEAEVIAVLGDPDCRRVGRQRTGLNRSNESSATHDRAVSPVVRPGGATTRERGEER